MTGVENRQDKRLVEQGRGDRTTRRFYNALTCRLTPYVPGEQPKEQGWIKLNTNENPFPPAPGVEQVLKMYVTEQLRRYPDPGSDELRTALARRFGLPPDCFFVGNGSDEVLAMAFRAFFKTRAEGGAPVLIPEWTYGFYPVYAGLFDIPLETIPLKNSLTVEPETFCGQSGGVVLANPNAPTGQLLSPEELEQIIAADRDRLVLVDEAYIDFGGESVYPLINRYDNLLVTQTFSKSRSLAGARLGFAMGQPDLIRGLLRVRDSFNSFTVDALTQAIGCAALADEPYFRATCDRIMGVRDGCLERLRAAGYDAPCSYGNFIWIRHPFLGGAELTRRLRERGILVRHFAKPGISDRVRITVGREEDMACVCRCLTDLI